MTLRHLNPDGKTVKLVNTEESVTSTYLHIYNESIYQDNPVNQAKLHMHFKQGISVLLQMIASIKEDFDKTVNQGSKVYKNMLFTNKSSES